MFQIAHTLNNCNLVRVFFKMCLVWIALTAKATSQIRIKTRMYTDAQNFKITYKLFPALVSYNCTRNLCCLLNLLQFQDLTTSLRIHSRTVVFDRFAKVTDTLGSLSTAALSSDSKLTHSHVTYNLDRFLFSDHSCA